MPSKQTQDFYFRQLVNPEDMNSFYNNVGDKINGFFPKTPSIMNGLKYTQTGTTNVIAITNGVIRWVDQVNQLSAVPQFTWAEIVANPSLAITCSVSVAQKYIVAKISKTQVSLSEMFFTGEMLNTAYTLAEIAAFSSPDEYAPIWTITNTTGIYIIGVDVNCAFNYGANISGDIYGKLSANNSWSGDNAFTKSPTVPTPALNDNSLKAINSAFMATNTSNATKYSYPISCKNTPTFAAGEEYILALNNFNGEGQYQLVFKGGYQVGTTNYGEIAINFSAEHTRETGYNAWGIQVIGITQSQVIGITQSALNALFTFTAYNLTTPVVINGASVSDVVLTIKLNSALPFTDTVNTLTGLFSTNNLGNYTAGANPNNNALLGITNGALTLATEGLTDEDGLNARIVLAPTYVTNTNVANMVNNNLVKWNAGLLQDSGIALANLALLSGAAFTVSPTVPTPTKGSNNTQVANMAALFAGLADKANQSSLANPIMLTSSIAGNNQTLSVSVSFTAPKNGVLHIIGSTNYGAAVSVNNTSFIQVNGAQIAADNTPTTRVNTVTMPVSAGVSYNVSLTGASPVPFSLWLSTIYVPNLV